MVDYFCLPMAENMLNSSNWKLRMGQGTQTDISDDDLVDSSSVSEYISVCDYKNKIKF